MKQMATAHRSVVDPPDFKSVPGPELQGILRELFQQADRWADFVRRGWCPPTRNLIDWRLTKTTAERVISDYDVTPQQVRAHVEVLLVRNRWWYCPFPGVLVCSPSVLDGGDFAGLLYQTFEGSLRK
jgi:hypothetical protein